MEQRFRATICKESSVKKDVGDFRIFLALDSASVSPISRVCFDASQLIFFSLCPLRYFTVSIARDEETQESFWCFFCQDASARLAMGAGGDEHVIL